MGWVGSQSRLASRINNLTFQTVINEMNRLGMIVDLSHSSVKTAMDTLEVSVAPVIEKFTNICDIAGECCSRDILTLLCSTYL